MTRLTNDYKSESQDEVNKVWDKAIADIRKIADNPILKEETIIIRSNNVGVECGYYQVGDLLKLLAESMEKI